jgi:glutathione S-transferase
MLEELGVAHQVTPSKARAAEVFEIHASGKVPVLIEDGHIIPDSTAILTYLADKHGALTHPAGTIARAQQDAVTQRILDVLEAPLWLATRHSFILPKDQRMPEVIPALVRDFTKGLAKLGDELSTDYIAGDQFTIADIVMVHVMSWAIFMKFPLEHEGLKAYSKRVRARPAYFATQTAAKSEVTLG